VELFFVLCHHNYAYVLPSYKTCGISYPQPLYGIIYAMALFPLHKPFGLTIFVTFLYDDFSILIKGIDALCYIPKV